MILAAGSVLLDAARPGPGEEAGALLFSEPRRVLLARSRAEIPGLLGALDEAAAAGQHLAGFLAYEAGYAFHPVVPEHEPPGPLAWFGVYDAPRRLLPGEMEGRLEEVGAYRLSPSRFGLDRETYRERIARIEMLLREGDIEQLNLTAPLRFRLEGDPLGLYRDLRRRQRVPYGAALHTGEGLVLSLSPELFFRREGRALTMRPMKGTARRAPTLEADEARAQWLAADPKNRAENRMIVDLLAEEMAALAEPGSVRLANLFATERYETLWQMTSTVEARLREGVSHAEIFRALFPCGSVTGTPRRRAMAHIAELEGGPRGVYCGAIGHIAPGGRATFSVAIRTIELHGSEGRMGLGSAIVRGSEADAEYDECLLKARFLTEPPRPEFALLETMRWEDGCALLDLHLARLARAAAYFGFPFDGATVRARLAEHASGLPAGPHRLRLTLDRRGHVKMASAPLVPEASALRSAAVFPELIPSDDPFFRHKTTHRTFYERALAWARERGAEEALLLDERGEVAEGTFTNVFVERGGRLLTPPLEAGGLPGVQRAHLLATRPEAAEARLRVADLAEADALYLANAVRGLQRVTLLRI